MLNLATVSLVSQNSGSSLWYVIEICGSVRVTKIRSKRAADIKPAQSVKESMSASSAELVSREDKYRP